MEGRRLKGIADSYRCLEAWGTRVVRHKGYIDVKITSAADWKDLEPDVIPGAL
jgi:hypothetical protein